MARRCVLVALSKQGLCSAGLIAMFAALGCDVSELPSQSPTLPPAPEHGVQLVLPDMDIAAHTERMLCWYTTLPTEVDLWITSMQSWQTDGGHHVIGFITDETAEEAPDGLVIDCIEPESMARWIPLLTPTLSSSEDDRVELPDGLALRLKASTRLVIQSHYVNVTPDTIHARDVVNLWATSEALTPAAPYMTTTFDHVVPPGELYTATYDCPVDEDVAVYSAVGHMHEHGSSITIAAGSGGDMHEMYRVNEWQEAYRDAPPIALWPLDEPMWMSAGDSLRVSCTWDSRDVSRPMDFPVEMCASLLWLYPADDPRFCAAEL